MFSFFRGVMKRRLIVPLQFELSAHVGSFLWLHVLYLHEWEKARCTHWSRWLYFIAVFSRLQLTVRLIFVVSFEPLNLFFLFVVHEQTLHLNTKAHLVLSLYSTGSVCPCPQLSCFQSDRFFCFSFFLSVFSPPCLCLFPEPVTVINLGQC